MTIDTHLYGIMAEFDDPDKLLEATARVYAEGYRKMDAYTPFPVHGLSQALGHRGVRLPYIVLIGGIIGGLTGFGMQLYGMAFDYPVNIGGRPLNNWPAFIPITIEMTILVGAP